MTRIWGPEAIANYHWSRLLVHFGRLHKYFYELFPGSGANVMSETSNVHGAALGTARDKTTYSFLRPVTD